MDIQYVTGKLPEILGINLLSDHTDEYRSSPDHKGEMSYQHLIELQRMYVWTIVIVVIVIVIYSLNNTKKHANITFGNFAL